MTTAIEYALLAGASYYDTRTDINRFPIPTGWVKITNPDSHVSDTTTGFEAISFTNGTEIVISYAGTYDKSAADIGADIGLALGDESIQLLQAAQYYLTVKRQYPNATITLTGHSLGGGLAALIGVFFGITTTTFDQAPFANAAQDPAVLASGNPLNILTPDVAAKLKTALLASGYTDFELTGLTNFLQQREANGGIPNSELVSNINVQGEFLSVLPIGLYDRIGTEISIPNNTDNVSGTDLHAQALLTAYLQSNQTAEANKALHDVTFQLPDLLKMIFDKNLFAFDTDKPEENFLERLVKHEATVIDPVTKATDAMVTRFTADLWKLAQEGGMTMKDGNADTNHLSKALIAFAMQKYYEEETTSAGYKKELFTEITGGIQFDMADVSDKFATAFANNEKLDLSDAKGFDLYLKYFFDNNLDFNNNFTVEEDALILSMLPYMRDWYIQAGASGMTASDANGFGNGAFIPHSPSLAEDKNLFEVLGGTVDQMRWQTRAGNSSSVKAANDETAKAWRDAA